jgi:ParB/RepB/Spo0J family partition protein
MTDQIINLPLSALQEDPHNTRTSYDPDKLEELADSIQTQGILQPIVARPLYPAGDAPTDARERYRVVFGHRRLRAAFLAGLEWAPVIVREMSDEDAAIAQLIENAQREDVTALEEADGFRRLIDEFRVTVADLIKRTGKSKAFVYGRLKLVHLAPEARKALVDGVIDAEVAQVVARLPHAVQAEALANVTEYDAHRKVRVGVSSREAKRRLANYLTDLSRDAEFPLGHAGLSDTAPACTGCAKRSGNSPDMQAELGDNTCTDRRCFEAKSVAFVRLQLDVARAKGQQVIEGDDARELQRYAFWPIEGHARLTEQVYGGQAHGTQEVRELLATLGEKAPASR